MENSIIARVMTGLTSALLIAPVVAPAASAIAVETRDLVNDLNVVTIYENDFSETTYPDTIIDTSGNAQLEWTDGLDIERNENASGVWVRERTNDYDGIDIPFDAIGMEEGLVYTIQIQGFIEEDEIIAEGSSMHLETVDGYTWLNTVTAEAGEMFELEAEYTAFDKENDRAFRIKTNSEGAEVDFAVTNISIITDGVSGEEPTLDPDTPAAEGFSFVDFEDGELNGFSGRGNDEVVEITDIENHTEAGQYGLFTSNRTEAWNGPTVRVENYITVGEEYQVSAWVKTNAEIATEIRLSTQVAEGDGASYNTITSRSISASDGWVQLEGTYRYTTLGGGFVTVYIETASGLADFYTDDIGFEQIASDPIQVDLNLTPIHEVYENDFLIGNAISLNDMEGSRLELLNQHHNLVTAENAMKPGYAYDDDGDFDFSGSNQLVERMNEEGLMLHGHVLVWHQQSPEWLHSNEEGAPLSREEALSNMQAHIRNAMKNYGEIYGENLISWDVVNEALDGDWGNPENWQGQLRDSGWLRAIGDDYIYEAFKYARQVADENGWEDLVLFYNDYNDDQQSKAQTMYYMIKDINEQYAAENPTDSRKLISGVGMQAHYNINTNPDNVRLSVERFIELDIEIGVTELDVTTLTPNETVESELQRQAYIYARLFQIYDEYSEYISRVTFWGLNDTNSWRSDRSPLLFDGTLSAKPAYYAVIDPEGFLADYEEEEIAANSNFALYGTPEINAEIDEMWGTVPELDISRFQSAWQGAKGTGRVLWDENYLYVLFQVSDSDLDISAENPWEQDSVETFVNETGEDTATYIEGVGQYRVNYANDASFNPASYSEGFKSMARVTDGGYMVEMAIPWKAVTPVAGHNLGFDLQINDGEEGSRVSSATWNDMTGQGFQDPSVFGNLTLVNDLSEIGQIPTDPDGDEEDESETPLDEKDTDTSVDEEWTDIDKDAEVPVEKDEDAETTVDKEDVIEKDTDDEQLETETKQDLENDETLPQTATAVWAVGSLGLTGILTGVGIRFIRKRN